MVFLTVFGSVFGVYFLGIGILMIRDYFRHKNDALNESFDQASSQVQILNKFH